MVCEFQSLGFLLFRGCFCSLQRVQLVILDQKNLQSGQTRLNIVELKLFLITAGHFDYRLFVLVT